MRVISIVMAVVVVAFLGIGSVFAGPQGAEQEGAGKNGFHGGRFLRVLDKLSLNADQENEIASILGKYRDEIGTAIAGVMEAGQGLRIATAADEYSESAVRQAAQNVSEMEVQAAVLRARIMNEIRSVLTVQQIEQLKNFAAGRPGRIKGFIDARLANLDQWIAEHAR